MARALAPALLLPLLATSAAAEVSVQARGAHVDLAATAAPLAEVLDRLARQVGMKVVYEGPAPRQLVTVTLKDRTPAEAVLSLLEGQGVNYALVSEENGGGVRTLLLAGAAPASATAAPSRAAAPPLQTRRPFGPPQATAGDPVDSFEADQEDMPETPPGTPPTDTGAESAGPPPGAADPNNPGAAAAQGNPAATPGAPQAPVSPPVQQYPVSPFALRPPSLGAGGVGSTTTPAPAPTPKPPQ